MNLPNQYMVCVQSFTYNQGAYIVDALNGFCMQKTNFPYVCVIIDDKSNDGEIDVLKQYLHENFDTEDSACWQDTENFVSVFAQCKKNKNCYFFVLFLKYNHYCLKKDKTPYFRDVLRKSKYIALCEGDDYWTDEEKLMKQVAFLEKNPDYSLSHSNYVVYNENTKSYAYTGTVEKNNELIQDSMNPVDILYRYRIRTLTVVARRDLFEKVTSLDPFLWSGYFLMGDVQCFYLLAKFGKVHYLTDRTAVRRINPNSATQQQSIVRNLRFTLSSAELRVYLAEKEKFSKELCSRFRKTYDNALFLYLLFDKEFKPLYPLNAENVKREYILLNRFKLLKIKIKWNFLRQQIKNCIRKILKQQVRRT